jgi:hypothetical protein
MPSCSYAKSLAPRLFRSLLAEKGLEKGAGARNSPAHFLLQRLPFSSACHSPAPTVLQRLPFSSACRSPAPTHSPAPTILQLLCFQPLSFSSYFLSPDTSVPFLLWPLPFSSPFPSLLPLVSPCLWCQNSSGVSLGNVMLHLWWMSEEENAWLDMPHAENLSATPLANLTAQVAGGVIEASGNV